MKAIVISLVAGAVGRNCAGRNTKGWNQEVMESCAAVGAVKLPSSPPAPEREGGGQGEK